VSPGSSDHSRVQAAYGGYDAGGRAKWSEANPGNVAMRRERERVILEALDRHWRGSLAAATILDVGCGWGHVLGWLESAGASAPKLHGVDLMPNRVAAAREAYPAYRFDACPIEELEVEDGSVDLAVCFTLFSSIDERDAARRVAARIDSLVAPGGAIAWYDLRYPNPWNRNVRAIGRSDVSALFPRFEAHLRSLTVIPQLSRRLPGRTGQTYPWLARVPALRSHLGGVLVRVA